MLELDHKQGWALKNWCLWIVALEKTLESLLECKEIKSVNPKGNQPWIFTGIWMTSNGDFPGSSDGKASAYNAGELGSIPGLGRSPGEGNGHPLQCSCLENPMDGGCWWAIVQAVAKSWTRLSDFTFTIHWKDWCWSWSSKPLATWWDEPTHYKRPRCWERLRAGGEGRAERPPEDNEEWC